MNNIALQLSEDKVQHIVEMHSDIGGYTERLSRIALPAFHVPFATASDVGELNFMLVVLHLTTDLLFQINDGLVVTQLQNVKQPLASFTLGQGQVIQHCGGGHEGLLTDHIATQSQTCGDMWMMEIVG
ncbi:hypothetical protein D3C73_1229010 [compost metagenome]